MQVLRIRSFASREIESGIYAIRGKRGLAEILRKENLVLTFRRTIDESHNLQTLQKNRRRNTASMGAAGRVKLSIERSMCPRSLAERLCSTLCGVPFPPMHPAHRPCLDLHFLERHGQNAHTCHLRVQSCDQATRLTCH